MRSRERYLLGINIIEMVLDELHAGRKVSLVEFVRDVPAQGTELPSLLDGSVQEGHCVKHWLPLVEVGDVQLFLCDAGISPFQTCLDSLWRLIGKLDAGLKWDKVLVLVEMHLHHFLSIHTLMNLIAGFLSSGFMLTPC